ncbi:MAG: HNH endonuclease signature motif containing protein [Tychonema bourrellyi B0820]|uniref:HNH endonuclease n=1 Tax=Tychonema bourrellyi FEM_GT703 TaxID=2040638 RepID=A0A2G4F4M9_9CYAN|nr:HNH endonuclease signature motif containing protein [Tychonema bourrellyi]MDQ2100188.1 HNH endonuclease signature motif containing protein [Tychonema bourrellyi B0820]PHX56671.1 HNH endonuclease [Tychonema bourrellyi FEM_GT703]
MTLKISPALRREVFQRAEGRCEYCRLHQDFSIYTHEVDHVVARKHGGKTVLENLALSCLPCNRYKGSDLTSIDPQTGEITRLFDPRSDVWPEHFILENGRIIGLSAIGRTTIFLLKINIVTAVRNRQLFGNF